MKRCLTKLVVLLLLGAIVNVAVAWLASYGALRSAGGLDIPPPIDVERVWSIYALPGWPDAPSEHFSRDDDAFVGLGGAHQWSRFALRCILCRIVGAERIRPPGMGLEYWTVFEVQAGWPTRCLRGGVRHSSSLTATESVDALFLPESKNVTASTNLAYGFIPTGRLFVYRPIWPGLVINTVFYAFAALTFLSIPRCVTKIRRVVRLDFGRCPVCGYNLREKGQRRARYLLLRGCPERGWRREAGA